MTHGEIRLERTASTQGLDIVDADCGKQALGLGPEVAQVAQAKTKLALCQTAANLGIAIRHRRPASPLI